MVVDIRDMPVEVVPVKPAVVVPVVVPLLELEVPAAKSLFVKWRVDPVVVVAPDELRLRVLLTVEPPDCRVIPDPPTTLSVLE